MTGVVPGLARAYKNFLQVSKDTHQCAVTALLRVLGSGRRGSSCSPDETFFRIGTSLGFGEE